MGLISWTLALPNKGKRRLRQEDSIPTLQKNPIYCILIGSRSFWFFGFGYHPCLVCVRARVRFDYRIILLTLLVFPIHFTLFGYCYCPHFCFSFSFLLVYVWVYQKQPLYLYEEEVWSSNTSNQIGMYVNGLVWPAIPILYYTYFQWIYYV